MKRLDLYLLKKIFPEAQSNLKKLCICSWLKRTFCVKWPYHWSIHIKPCTFAFICCCINLKNYIKGRPLKCSTLVYTWAAFLLESTVVKHFTVCRQSTSLWEIIILITTTYCTGTFFWSSSNSGRETAHF